MKIALNLLSKFQIDINNLEEYTSLVVEATVKTGIMRQMESFRAGFNQVIYADLNLFNVVCAPCLVTLCRFFILNGMYLFQP